MKLKRKSSHFYCGGDCGAPPARGCTPVRRIGAAAASALLLLFAIIPAPYAQQTLPSDMHGWATASADFVFKEDFRSAEAEAQKIIRAYPDHPAGYFFMAAVADAWMLRYQSSRKEAEFYRYCDQAVEKAEKMLAKDPKDEWARFFMGGADGYKGTYEARYERFITAFKSGWKGVSVFLAMDKERCAIPDIQFGIGTYDYWRSALMKMLWWMPGVPDKRVEGITKLRGVMNNGLYTRTAAAMVLAEIYINEGLFQDALNLCDRMLRQYPRAMVFQWFRGAALHGLKRHDEAVTVYQQLLNKVEADAGNNFFNSVRSRMGMARNLAAMGKNAEALEQLDAINGYNLSKDIRKRLDSMFSEANGLRKKVGG